MSGTIQSFSNTLLTALRQHHTSIEHFAHYFLGIAVHHVKFFYSKKSSSTFQNLYNEIKMLNYVLLHTHAFKHKDTSCFSLLIITI